MKDFMPVPCDEWAEKLAATHANDLSLAEQEALDAHIASCISCAAVRTEYLAMKAFLQDIPDTGVHQSETLDSLISDASIITRTEFENGLDSGLPRITVEQGFDQADTPREKPLFTREHPAMKAFSQNVSNTDVPRSGILSQLSRRKGRRDSMSFQGTLAVDYYALLGVPLDVSLGEIKNAYRRLIKRYHPDVYRFDDLATRKKAELLMRQINEAYAVLSDSKKRQSYDDEYITSHINSPTSDASIGTETEFGTGPTSDWPSVLLQRLFDQIDTFQRRPLFMGVFRKVWLLPIPFCMAAAASSAFWNLGQMFPSTMFLGELTAVLAYPLIIVLLLRRLTLPILHRPLLDIKQKLACLPLIIVLAIFAGWIWSVEVDHYHIISNRWDLCFWSGLIAITCGILAYL